MRRAHQNDVCKRGRVTSNQFDRGEWLKLWWKHSARYEEWLQSQTFFRVGRSDVKADVWRNDRQVRLCPFRLKRDERAEEPDGAATPRVSSGRSPPPNISTDPNPCAQPMRRSSKATRQSRMEDDGRSGRVRWWSLPCNTGHKYPKAGAEG